MFLIFLILLLPTSLQDTICVSRAVAFEEEMARSCRNQYGLEQTMVPGIVGAGMRGIIEFTSDTWTYPVAILGDSRTDPNKPQWNDIDPRLQKVREGSSLSSWGIFRWAASHFGPMNTAIPTYRRRAESMNFIYQGVNDHLEQNGGPEWWHNVRDFYRAFKKLHAEYMVMSSITTAGTIVSGRSVCQSPGKMSVSAPAGGKCLMAFFARDIDASITCLAAKGTLSGKKMEIYIYDDTVHSLDFNCHYTCRHYCFTEPDPTPEYPIQIFSPIDQARSQYTEFLEFTQEANVSYGRFYPTDGADSIHGSPTVRRWMGFPGTPGTMFKNLCETDGGGTNVTEGFAKVGYLPGVTVGGCGTLVSSKIDVPRVPTLYATRTYAGRGKPETRITLGGILVTIFGGIAAGPLGALIGLSGALSGGGGFSKHDVDLEIDRKLAPALKTINENFERQAVINSQLMDITETFAEAIRHLTENQLQTQLELTATTMILNSVAISDEAAKTLKEQLRAYAHKNGIPWDETTGCLEFSQPCDDQCLEGIVNDTVKVEIEVDFIRNITFGVAELAPDVKQQLEWGFKLGLGSSIALGVVGLLVVAGGIIALCVFCKCYGGSLGGGSGGKQNVNIKV